MKSKIFNGLLIFSRIFVGALFIVSGMVKANDPLGFSYKMEEYFSEGALGWTFFEPYALIIGTLVTCGEVILGFAILFGGKPKLTIWLILGLIVFFTGLTFYTATCDPAATYKVNENGVQIEKAVQCVTDCGCFGDALKGTIGRSLTPWESFYKDVILLVFSLILFFGKGRVKLNSSKDDAIILGGATVLLILFAGIFFQWWFPVVFSLICFGIYLVLKRKYISFIGPDFTIAIAMSIASFGFAWYCYNYLPVKDFTPYAVGKSIPEGMKSAEELGMKPPVYAFPYKMKNSKTGEEVTVRSDEWLANKKWQAAEWQITGTGPQILVEEGYIPPIPAFSMEVESDSGLVDIASSIIQNDQQAVLLMVTHDLSITNENNMAALNQLAEQATKSNILFYGATSNSTEDIKKFCAKHKLKFNFVISDGQGILKPMVRSNPGLLLLKNGVILGKWHNNALPDFSEIQGLLK